MASGPNRATTIIANAPQLCRHMEPHMQPKMPVFGQLIFAILTRIFKPAALHAQTTARILEATTEAFCPSLKQSAQHTTTWMETPNIKDRNQMAQHPSMSCNHNQEGSHATSAIMVQTGRRYQQTEGKGGGLAQN
jgi:hypothetical protein